MGPILEKFVVLVFSWIIFTSSNVKISYEMALVDVMSYNEFTMLPVPSICKGRSLQSIPDPFTANLKGNSLDPKIQSGAVLCSDKSVKAWNERTKFYLSGNTSFRSLSFSECAVQKIYADFLNAPFPNFSSKGSSWHLHLLDVTESRESNISLDEIDLADTFTKYVYPVNTVSFSGTQMERIFSKRSSIKAISLPTISLYIASTSVPSSSIAAVQYEEKLNQIEVTMKKEVLMAVSLDMENFLNHYSYFGFTSSSKKLTLSDGVSFLWDSDFSEVEDMQKQDDHTRLETDLIIAVCTLSMSLLLTFIAGALYCFSKRKVLQCITISRVLRALDSSLRKFNFHDLKKATENFGERQKLGQGGRGTVYRGQLHKENKEVAIKKIAFSRSMKDNDDFLTELRVISCLRHKHLVQFHGWCYNKGILLFVYDYMPYGSLDKHLFGGSAMILSWSDRYKISLGVASALQYLHNGADKKVVHRSVKSSNVMLDTDLNARLGDYELTRALDNEKSKTIRVELEGFSSTFVYTAPECMLTGNATEESDVYGLGIILLEVTCGRRPWTKIGSFQFLVEWVMFLYSEGRILEAIDKKLGKNIVVEEAERVLLLGLACSHPVAEDRPKSKDVLQMLSGCMPTPDMSPFTPTAPSLQQILQKTKH